MAKRGLEFSNIQSVLKHTDNKAGWSLCIGAGTSLPAISDWYSLVEKLINENCSTKEKIDINTYKNMGFSADAMIQAVKNILGLSNKDFVMLLSEAIYSPIREKVTIKQWKSFCNIHETTNPAQIKTTEWLDFDYIKENILKQTSANLLAEVVVESIQNNIDPKSILTFNGESIFYSLLNYYYYFIKKIDKKSKFDRIVNSISNQVVARIPYIHCHGIIPINGIETRKGKKAVDKLVFSEDTYLQIANNSFSWQATSFIGNCLNSKIVFIGVSLTDANMRRWLSWVHSNKVREFEENGIEYENSTDHFWINKTPSTAQEKIWMEESVAHLGVRLVWIDNWYQTGAVLRKMLSL